MTEHLVDPDVPRDLHAFIAGLPKAELHVHHVGSASPRIVSELAARHPDSKVPTDPEALADYFTFTDFAHFIDVYLSVVDLVRTPEDVRLLTYEVARDMARQQVRYAELTITPFSSTRRGIDEGAFMDAIEDARKAAEAEFGTQLRWCFDIPGEAGLESAEETARLATDDRLRPEGLVSFGLGGPEIGVARPQFKPYFDRAIAADCTRLAARDRVDRAAAVWGAPHRPVRAERRTADQCPPELLAHRRAAIQAGDGLGDDFAQLYAHRFDTLTPQEVAASAIAKGPEFEPGERQHYLNINYTILGLLIEEVTGRSYAAEATGLVLRPAGMRHTYFPGTDPRIRGPHNRGYQTVERPDGTTKLLDVTEWNQADRWAAGDMISTTADLERLLTSLFRGRIVPEPQLEEMFTTPPGLPDAILSAGLEYQEVDGEIFWGKSGSRYGYSALFGGTRDLSRTLVCSVNATDAKSAEPNPVLDAITAAALK
ncbi:Adenine deaminase [Streptomyces violaceorubidus]